MRLFTRGVVPLLGTMLVLVAVGASMPLAPAAAATVRSNTQARMPYNLYFADLDGDGLVELLQVGANKVFGFKADFAGTPMLHTYYGATVRRLVVGHFATTGREHDRDDVCAILADGSLNCSAPNPDGNELWWWFTQPSFIADTEQAVVGDFDGNGSDDILVYNPGTGAIRMYTREVGGSQFFQPMPAFGLGNLAPANRTNKILLAGEFGQAGNRADLLLFDPTAGQVSRYDSATNPSTGVREFWWAFTTTSAVISTTETLSVARLDGGARDGIVLRDRTTGAVRVKRAELTSANTLVDESGIDTTGLVQPTTTGSLVFAKLARWASEPAGSVRDDALFFNASSQTMVRYEARWDGSRYVYWSAYEKIRPTLDEGWNSVVHDPWTVLMCTVNGTPAPLAHNAAWWQQNFNLGYLDGAARYYWDMSYGTLDLSGGQVLGPYAIDPPVAGGGDGRNQLYDGCRRAAGLATTPGHILVYVNVDTAGGQPGMTIVGDPVNDTDVVHEMGHNYGLGHAADDDLSAAHQEYDDLWSAMGNDGGGACYNATFGCTGPGLNAANRLHLPGAVPASSPHIRQLWHGSTRQTTTLNLTMLDRPEAGATGTYGPAYLAVRLPLPAGVDEDCRRLFVRLANPDPSGVCSAGPNYYTIEFRQPQGWDRSHPGAGVQIHKVFADGSLISIIKNGLSGTYGAGATFQDPNLSVRVVSVDLTQEIAVVTITY